MSDFNVQPLGGATKDFIKVNGLIKEIPALNDRALALI